MLDAIRADMFDRGGATMVGRFELRRLLGRGAFGSVYLAYDPTLERKVAVKVLDASVRQPSDRARMLREARALAQLEHPNVLTIYDVVVDADRVVIAMELVEGGTLVDWIERNAVGEAGRFAALLDLALGAARGLSAAHDAGITHRDIKPANILIGDDGRPRVADFGIARAATERPEPEAGFEVTANHTEAVTGLSRSAAVAGTPAFMAPEQFDGVADAASDQWGLCATLWYAAYGESAYRGDTVPERAAAVRGPPVDPPNTAHGVPEWFRKVLVRGLQPIPSDRWPSVSALADALVKASRGRIRRRVALAASAVATTVVLGVGATRLDHARRLAACDAQADPIAAVWNEGVEQTVRVSMRATGAGHAASTAERVSARVEAYADDWRAVAIRVCQDEVSGDWSSEVRERAMWCLDDRLAQLSAVLERLQHADTEAVNNAVSAATALRQVEPCGQPATLARLPIPSRDRSEVSAVRDALERAVALEATGAYEAGLELAQAQLERATAIGWPPLVASAQARVGLLLLESGDFPGAESMLQAAYFTALEAGATEVAYNAARLLVHAVGVGQSRHDDGRKWWEHAETMRTQLPDDDGLRQAASLRYLAALEYERGAYVEAYELDARALTLREQALGTEHPKVADSLTGMANGRHEMGAYAEAKELHARALETRRAAFGPDHPIVAQSLTNLGEAHRAMGAFDEAAEFHEQALRIREAALGREHPEVALSLNNKANTRLQAEAYEEAAALHRRALEIRRAAFGPEHPDVAQSLSNLGEVHRMTEAYEDARRSYEEALRILEVALGPHHLRTSHVLNNLALVHSTMGNDAKATELYRRALKAREAAVGLEHPLIAQTLTNLASLRMYACDLDEAEAQYQRALSILEATLPADHPHIAFPLVGLANIALMRYRVGPPSLAERAVKLRGNGRAPGVLLAEARFLLAQSLLESGEDSERPLRLARQARDVLRARVGPGDASLAEVQTWIERVESGEPAPTHNPCDAARVEPESGVPDHRR